MKVRFHRRKTTQGEEQRLRIESGEIHSIEDRNTVKEMKKM